VLVSSDKCIALTLLSYKYSVIKDVTYLCGMEWCTSPAIGHNFFGVGLSRISVLLMALVAMSDTCKLGHCGG